MTWQQRVLRLGRRRGLWLLIVVVISLVLSAFWARQQFLHTLSMREGAQLQLRAQALQHLIDRYRVLPTSLALDGELQRALEDPSHADIRLLNRKLERINGATHLSTLTLIDRHGTAVAASNWREATSNVGDNYGFRPYFKQAMETGQGAFYAIGVSTHVPGYFMSRAITNAKGVRIGVISVKLTLSQLREEWGSSTNTILLSDNHGIVFFSNAAAWLYRPLHPLSDGVIDGLRQTRQYQNKIKPTARLSVTETLGDGGKLMAVTLNGDTQQRLVRRHALPIQGWTLWSLHPVNGVVIAILKACLFTLGLWLPLILLGLFLKQRMRLASVSRRNREELEQLVAYYVGALRVQQDSLVAAALDAINGRCAGLEALPQGVSVVDAELRLVAWNSRYSQVFSYPEALLKVGQPIEFLMRYNAQVGLLRTADDLEAGIAKRLAFLREGGSYLYERQRSDGRVIEIRGQPLPGGGFVTSYADITPYKKAARALRSLTRTLEDRVDRATIELRLAKGEAERANRDKTRYVAAAVHDLLQPLNAARLFAGAMELKPLEAEQRDMLQRVETALEALDDQFGSMLALSRLEGGIIKAHVEPQALGPMLDALGQQFSIMAEAAGVTLKVVPTHAWVQSDAMLLRRLLQNFLSNALHYTATGKVLLGCRRIEGHLRVEVWDTGIGVPADKRAAIFEAFTRLDTGRDTDERSAGLGLAIVERIAGVLGHRLALRSWPGRGSVFSVELPLIAAPAAPAKPRLGSTFGNAIFKARRLLCVDDDAASCEAQVSLLEGWGCEVEVWRSLPANLPEQLPRVDAILLDYQLGKDCGLDLLPLLEARWGELPPVIVVTANSDKQLHADIRAQGLSLLRKPVSPAKLRALLSRLLARRPAG